MKKRSESLLITVCFLLLCFDLAAQRTNSYAIRNVNVIPMNRDIVLSDQTILVKNGVITAIGDARKIKIGSEFTMVVDGKGKYVMPGLFDMHAHFFYEQGENINTCENELKMMLGNGLTTVRIMCGDPVYLEARAKVAHQQWAGPTLFVASPQVVGSWPWPGKVFAAICKTPQDAENAVRQFRKDGYDAVKITFMVKRDVYDAIIKTAREENIKVTGHVGPQVKLPAALEAREQIEHMDEFIDMLLPDATYNNGESVSDMNIWRKNAWATVPYLDERKIPALVKMVKESGVSVTPTNYFFLSSFGEATTEEEIHKKPDIAFIPPAIFKERWKIRDHYWNNAPPQSSREKYVMLRKKMTYELWKGGVPLMAGSDSPEWFLTQGFSIHDEIEMFVKAGLTPFAALQTATINPATYLEVSDAKGTIEVGKVADLILLDKNPLEDIRNTRSIHAVGNGSNWYAREALNKMMEDARALGKP